MTEEAPVAHPSESLRDLVPGYLERMKSDLAKAREDLARGELSLVERFGHRTSGSGGGYGFPALTRFGREIEEAARVKDPERAARGLAGVEDYLKRVRIQFEED